MAEFNEPTHEQIKQRAYELFVECGCEHGRDLEHWLAAEHELSKLALNRALRQESQISTHEELVVRSEVEEWPLAPKKKSANVGTASRT
jgi:hypothetical protein